MRVILFIKPNYATLQWKLLQDYTVDNVVTHHLTQPAQDNRIFEGFIREKLSWCLQ
jgi:hypothetical protein